MVVLRETFLFTHFKVIPTRTHANVTPLDFRTAPTFAHFPPDDAASANSPKNPTNKVATINNEMNGRNLVFIDLWMLQGVVQPGNHLT